MQVQQHVQRQPSLRDKLFVFAALDRSPDPARLAETAAKSRSGSIRWRHRSLPRTTTAKARSSKLLFAFGRGSDDDQQALRVVLEPGLHVEVCRDTPARSESV
jgi:hypothetical protein